MEPVLPEQRRTCTQLAARKTNQKSEQKSFFSAARFSGSLPGRCAHKPVFWRGQGTQSEAWPGEPTKLLRMKSGRGDARSNTSSGTKSPQEENKICSRIAQICRERSSGKQPPWRQDPDNLRRDLTTHLVS
jgi:hypothetical protein